MRGQLIFEFIVATVLFFGIVLYIIGYLSSTMAATSADFYSSSLQNKAVQISEFLVRKNLSEEWPILNSDSIENLGEICDSPEFYVNFLKSLDLLLPYGGRYNIKIQIEDLDKTPVLDCGPEPAGIDIASVKRVALSEDLKFLFLNVWVW